MLFGSIETTHGTIITLILNTLDMLCRAGLYPNSVKMPQKEFVILRRLNDPTTDRDNDLFLTLEDSSYGILFVPTETFLTIKRNHLTDSQAADSGNLFRYLDEIDTQS